MADVLVPPSLDGTFGAAFIGIVVSTFFFGVNTLQVYNYYHRFPRDSIVFKSAVGFLWAADALHTALATHGIYRYLVTGFGNYLALDRIVWSMKAENIITDVVIAAVHTLYAVRLWRLHTSLDRTFRYRTLIPWAIGIALLAAYGAFFLSATQLTRTTFFSQIVDADFSIYVPLAIATLVDVAIVCGSCAYLRPGSVDARVSSTKSMLSRLVAYTLATGLVTSAASLAALLCSVLMPHNMVFLALQLPLAKLYVLSILTMLNMRARNAHPSRYVGPEGSLAVQLTTVAFTALDVHSGGTGTADTADSDSGFGSGSGSGKAMNRQMPDRTVRMAYFPGFEDRDESVKDFKGLSPTEADRRVDKERM